MLVYFAAYELSSLILATLSSLACWAGRTFSDSENLMLQWHARVLKYCDVSHPLFPSFSHHTHTHTHTASHSMGVMSLDNYMSTGEACLLQEKANPPLDFLISPVIELQAPCLVDYSHFSVKPEVARTASTVIFVKCKFNHVTLMLTSISGSPLPSGYSPNS